MNNSKNIWEKMIFGASLKGKKKREIPLSVKKKKMGQRKSRGGGGERLPASLLGGGKSVPEPE